MQLLERSPLRLLQWFEHAVGAIRAIAGFLAQQFDAISAARRWLAEEAHPAQDYYPCGNLGSYHDTGKANC